MVWYILAQSSQDFDSNFCVLDCSKSECFSSFLVVLRNTVFLLCLCPKILFLKIFRYVYWACYTGSVFPKNSAFFARSPLTRLLLLNKTVTVFFLKQTHVKTRKLVQVNDKQCEHSLLDVKFLCVYKINFY